MKTILRSKLSSIAILIALLLPSIGSVNAQGGNLLQNGDMEGGYASRDGVTGVPNGWAFWAISGSPDADRQSFAPYSFSLPTSWAVRSTYGSWVAGGRQTVQVTPGITYELGAHVFVWTCNDDQWSCIPEGKARFSHTESNARVRVGIDPNGGVDPNSPNIIWSDWIQAFDSYYGIRVAATATTTNMSVFLMGDAGTAMAFNEIYWDDMTLSATNAVPVEVANAAPGQVAPVAPVAAPIEVPFVTPQQTRPDGSVVHTVQSGDTFDSILVAYIKFGISRDIVLQLNNWRFPPQFINIGDQITILPPGSVDPATGQLLSLPTLNQPAPAPPPQANAAPAPLPSPETVDTTSNIETKTMTSAEIAAMAPVETVSPFLPQQ